MTEDEILNLTMLDIAELWRKDSIIDKMNVGEESIKTSDLHSKYIKIMVIHSQQQRIASRAFKKIYRLRFMFYNGTLAKEDAAKYGWPTNPLTIMKADLPIHMNGDDLLQKAEAAVTKHDDIIELCRTIIKEITNRSYNLRIACDWIKITEGAN